MTSRKSRPTVTIHCAQRDYEFIILPTSCSCGGDRAVLMKASSGAQRMIGCVCHTTISDLLYMVDES